MQLKIVCILLALCQLYNISALNYGQDFSDVDFSSTSLKIDENIEFYWDTTLEPSDEFINPDEIVSFPFDWSKNYSMWGSGTFRTHLKLPKNSEPLGIKFMYTLDNCKVYINGVLVYQNYFYIKNKGNIRRDSSAVISLPKSQDIDIVIQVTNFDDNHGGMALPPIIGNLRSLNRSHNRSIILEGILFGALVVTGLLFLSFYISKPDDKPTLYLGLFSLVLGLRTILYGEHILLMVFAYFSLELEATLGHLTFYISVPLFMKFLAEAFPYRNSDKLLKATYLVSGLYVAFAIIFPHRVLIQLLLYYQIFTLIVSTIAIVVLIRRAVKKNSAAIISLIGFFVLLATAINDILLSQEVVVTTHLTPFGMLFFVFSQGILLCWGIARSYLKAENLSKDLTLANRAFKRFVPEEFLNILGKKKITEIKLGDHVQLNMTIMFCDIRDFTSLSERMTPKENFMFINSFLERIGPVIREHGGFIDKYMGDGLMSIFPEGADTAVDAAFSIQRILKIYNEHRKNSGYESIKLGIGINTGSLMLGTIGENQRMDGTVISDAVNICSRIESITKEYGLCIAISEQTYSNLFRKDRLQIRNIGKIYLKGKRTPVSVYELYNLDPEEHIQFKNMLKNDFENAIALYEAGNNEEALKLFNKIHDIFPEDLTCSKYIFKIKDPVLEGRYFALY